MAFSAYILYTEYKGPMNWRSLFFISVPATALITVLLYGPVSVTLYRITEPRFSCPIKAGQKKMVIRNDAFGDGDFGARRGNGRSHSGIDILAAVGTPVYASKSGLAFCGRIPTGYGKYVMIHHPDGYQTMYGHLSEWAINPVKKVRRGELIGFVGKTGNAANRRIEPHLHFEIKKDGVPQEPRKLIR